MKNSIGILLIGAGLLGGEQLTPVAPGVPGERGGEVHARQEGAYLRLTARLPEPGGKALARSAGRNPVWERDAVEAPELEDRVRWNLRYESATGTARALTLEINPLGAYRIEEHGQLLPDLTIPRAAEVTAEGWLVEAAVPVKALDLDWNAPRLQVSAERIRPRRPLSPEFRWTTDLGTLTLTNLDGGEPPQFRSALPGNHDPALEIGRVLRLPAVEANWDDPAWRNVPAFELPRNEPHPRTPRYRTDVKWMHDGRTLALLARMEEPEPVVARQGGRDSAVTGDDHIAIYLATSGSAFVEIAVNSVGAIRDALGAGPRVTRPRASWNAGVETQTDIRHGAWIARIDIPLDECARALGETGVPRDWRILLARRRAARPGEAEEWSALPALDGVTTYYGPLRYRPMLLSDSAPASVKQQERVHPSPGGLAGELARLDSRVWTPSYRRAHAVRTMAERYLERKVEEAVLAERRAWEQVNSREAWERFRDERIRSLRESAGVFPPERPPLEPRVTATYEGEGYRLENVVFQVRPGYWMTANLYLPARPKAPMPAIILVHSQHFPRTQGELHDAGELWARAGCAVLVIERPGYGERVETSPWFRLAYGSRFNFTKQLFLVGESYSGWAAWDVIRSVDYLCERPEVDRERIILIGSVAGGGEIAGVAAALDPRIAAVVPFNYDQGHVRVHGDSPGQIARQFSPWLVAASVAPRRFVRAFEFGWEGAEEPDYPRLWVDGMERSRKVWGFYNAPDRLAASQAYGLIRLSMERVSHCFSIGPQQRKELHPIFQRWFGIPLPSAEDLAILPDSQLSTNPERGEAARQEAARRRPLADLVSITPAVSSELKRTAMHQLAFEMGTGQLEAARLRRAALGPRERREALRRELKPILGDMEPLASPRAHSWWTRPLPGATVEALSLEVEDGIQVPAVLIKPAGLGRPPVVVAVSQGGKDRFLANRGGQVERLTRAGIAVFLPDVRATGETAPSVERGDGGAFHSLAELEFDLGRSLLGSRLKDLRTALGYLRSRADVDSARLALWGDSFTPPNPGNLWLDEIEYEGGPHIQRRAEPLGAHLALLAALYEDGVRTVVARGGLGGYLSALESPVTYVPIEDILLGVLKAGDIADLAAALAPIPLLMEGQVDGRNIRVEQERLARLFEPARMAYREAGATESLTIRIEPGDPAAWLLEAFKRR
ncbi:MAG: acetylxylan esterase [Bryobacteraceae bacterium]|nr:acetylxylan esterase [Bryobacteraceae bacterium]